MTVDGLPTGCTLTAMRSIFAAAAALVALALGGCANYSGEWVTLRPTIEGGSADAIRLDLQPSGVAVGTIERGGATRCMERYTHRQEGRWFVNAAGELVVDISCDHEVLSCDGGGRTYNLCTFFEVVSPGLYKPSGDNLVSTIRRSPGILLERPSR